MFSHPPYSRRNRCHHYSSLGDLSDPKIQGLGAYFEDGTKYTIEPTGNEIPDSQDNSDQDIPVSSHEIKDHRDLLQRLGVSDEPYEALDNRDDVD